MATNQIDLNQLLAALASQRQNLAQPSQTPADIQAMEMEAKYLANMADRRSNVDYRTGSGNGALAAGVSWMAQNKAAKEERAAMEQLKQAMAAQGNIDQYQAQAGQLDEQMKYLYQQMIEQQIAQQNQSQKSQEQQDRQLAVERFKAENRPPKAPTQPSYVDLYNQDDGTTEKWIVGPDGSPVRKVGVTKPKATSDTEMSGKDLDIQEALGVLDTAESLLDNRTGLSGTGPIQGKVMQLSEWNQQFKATQEHLFAVAKRIYKTKGEGQFSDADARALMGMLIGENRNESVNKAIINSLRKSLASRSPSFADFQAEVAPLLNSNQDESGGQTMSAYEKWKRENGKR